MAKRLSLSLNPPNKQKAKEQNKEVTAAEVRALIKTGLNKINPKVSYIEYFMPSGALLLDLLMSNGRGYPLGRFIEIYGEEGAGKTVFAMTALCAALKFGGNAFYFAGERKFDFSFATMLASSMQVNFEDVDIEYPDVIEQALASCNEVILQSEKLQVPTVIVIDSIASLTGEEADTSGKLILKHAEKKMGARQQALSSWFESKSYKNLFKTKILIIGLNQVRDVFQKRGVVNTRDYNTPGGWSVRHNASIRLSLSSLKNHPSDKNSVEGSSVHGFHKGIFTKVTTVKNQVSPPYRQCIVPILFDPEWMGSIGIDDPLCSLTYLKVYKQMNYYNGNFEYNGAKYSVRDLRDLMLNDENVYADISNRVFNLYNDKVRGDVNEKK